MLRICPLPDRYSVTEVASCDLNRYGIAHHEKSSFAPGGLGSYRCYGAEGN